MIIYYTQRHCMYPINVHADGLCSTSLIGGCINDCIAKWIQVTLFCYVINSSAPIAESEDLAPASTSWATITTITGNHFA